MPGERRVAPDPRRHAAGEGEGVGSAPGERRATPRREGGGRRRGFGERRRARISREGGRRIWTEEARGAAYLY